ncbi:unnamed protein product [Gadus morhua 'NCC']
MHWHILSQALQCTRWPRVGDYGLRQQGLDPAVSEETLNVYALLGSNLTLSFDQKLLSYQDTLRWTHNNKVIFSRSFGVVRPGKPTDIDAAGSLQLLNLSDSSAGDYKADVYNRTGVRVNGWSGKVYVIVSTPVVTFLCGSSGATATLKCDVRNPKYVVFAWTHEGQLLTGETKPTLSVSLAKFKGDKGFSCSVSNGASKAQSNTVQLKCKPPPPPPPPPPKVYCFNASTVMAAVAGGVGLIMLLFIITVVACSRQKKAQTPEQQEDLLMASAAKLFKTDNGIQDYEIMHPSGETPRPSPMLSHGPLPTVYSQEVVPSVAKAQDNLGPTSTEVKRGPSPVPKPRTKAPKAPEK